MRGSSRVPVCPQLLHPPSLISLPPLPSSRPPAGTQPRSTHDKSPNSIACTQLRARHSSFNTATHPQHPNGEEDPSLPLHPILPIYPHGSADPISLLSSLAWTSPTFGKAPTSLPRLRLLQIPPRHLPALAAHCGFRWNCRPQTHLRGQSWLWRDKVGQEAGDGAGKERKRGLQAPGSAGFRFSHAV